MNEDILKSIHIELVAIRELLAKPPSASPARAASSLFSTPSAAQAEIPQPTKLIDDPGSVAVHFGKNTGRPLSELSERSVEWYASVKEPKLDNSGKPFTPRPQEIALENAARQIYHARKGTLGDAPKAGGGTQTERQAPAPRSAASGAGTAEKDSSEIPF